MLMIDKEYSFICYLKYVISFSEFRFLFPEWQLIQKKKPIHFMD